MTAISQAVHDTRTKLLSRAIARMQAHDDANLARLLEDTLVHERARLAESSAQTHDALADALRAIASSLRTRDRQASLAAAANITEVWASEIARAPSPRTWSVMRASLPWLEKAGARIDRGVRVTGDTRLVHALAAESTVIFAPTHHSNLDTAIVATALQLAGLPPVQYAAAREFFDRPVLGGWLNRLGAYPVDRRRHARLYKDLLIDHEVLLLTLGYHGLFFPQGHRTRNGAFPMRVKKGLLGSAVKAWQAKIQDGHPHPDVYIIPMTITWSTSLEARTLIHDALAAPSDKRAIIVEDEFSQPSRLASFTRSVLVHRDAVHVHFGAPLDVLGRPVAASRAPRNAEDTRRRGYVCDAHGVVEVDDQRDRTYTKRLAQSLVRAWRQGHTLLPSSLVALAAWDTLAQTVGVNDARRLAVSVEPDTALDLASVRAHFHDIFPRAHDLGRQGIYRTHLPQDEAAAFDAGLEHLARYHDPCPLRRQDQHLRVGDARVLLYYRNQAFAAFDALTPKVIST